MDRPGHRQDVDVIVDAAYLHCRQVVGPGDAANVGPNARLNLPVYELSRGLKPTAKFSATLRVGFGQCLIGFRTVRYTDV